MTRTTPNRKRKLSSSTLRAMFFLSFAAFPVLALVGKTPERQTSYVVAMEIGR